MTYAATLETEIYSPSLAPNQMGTMGVDSWVQANWSKYIKFHKSIDGEGQPAVAVTIDPEIWSKLSLIQKADTNLAVMTGGFGTLEPQFFNAFVQLLQLQPVVMQHADIVSMSAPSQRRAKITYGERFLHPAGETGNLPDGHKSALGVTGVELNVAKFRGAAPFSFDALLDAINQDDFNGQILQEITKAVGRDMEQNLNEGDTTSTQPYLAPFDGLVAAITSNIIAAGGADITREDLSNLLMKLPQQFRTIGALRHFMGDNTRIQLARFLSQRGTNLGDVYTTDDMTNKMMVDGVKVVGAGVWPQNLGVGGDQTATVLAAGENMLVGIWKDVTIQRDTDVGGEKVIYYVTVRWTFKYLHEPATAKLTGLTTPLAS